MMPNLFGTNIFDIMVQMQIAVFGALLFAANPNVAPGDCKRVIKEIDHAHNETDSSRHRPVLVCEPG